MNFLPALVAALAFIRGPLSELSSAFRITGRKTFQAINKKSAISSLSNLLSWVFGCELGMIYFPCSWPLA